MKEVRDGTARRITRAASDGVVWCDDLRRRTLLEQAEYPNRRPARNQAMSRHLTLVALVVLSAVSRVQTGFAEQPVERLPKDVVSFSLAWVALTQAMAEVTKDHGPLVGASWGVVKGSSEAAARIVHLMDEAPSATRPRQRETDRSPAWLNIDNGRSRRMRREPTLLRYTF